MDKRMLQRCIGGLRKIPGWLWRLGFSAGLGYAALVTAVPWAQAQRGYATFGGEYLIILLAVILPFIIFRRRA